MLFTNDFNLPQDCIRLKKRVHGGDFNINKNE